MMPITKSDEHQGFAGSFRLSATTLLAVPHDIATALCFPAFAGWSVELPWPQPGDAGELKSLIWEFLDWPAANSGRRARVSKTPTSAVGNLAHPATLPAPVARISRSWDFFG